MIKKLLSFFIFLMILRLFISINLDSMIIAEEDDIIDWNAYEPRDIVLKNG